MSGPKWLADKALASLRNVPRLDLTNVMHIGAKPVSTKAKHFCQFRDPCKN
jgi:hypothetical protein